MNSPGFDGLINAAEAQAFSGWDFSFLDGRWQEEPPPWDYTALARAAVQTAASLLDLGTGGGELLASLAPLPRHTRATENYPPNLPLARRALEPLGVQVAALESDEHLPFAEGEFDLVINRHESYDAKEVFRVLQPGGIFLTQQVGGRDCLGINLALGAEPDFGYAHWDLAYAAAELRAAGFELLTARESFPVTRVRDIGALVYYLKAIPWQIAGFSAAAYRARLLAIHEDMTRLGPLEVQSHRFILKAKRRG